MIGMVTNVAMIEIMLNVMASEDIKSADVVMLIVSKWNARFVVMRELQKEKMRSGFMKEICDLIGNQNVQTSMEDWNARSCQKFSARLLKTDNCQYSCHEISESRMTSSGWGHCTAHFKRWTFGHVCTAFWIALPSLQLRHPKIFRRCSRDLVNVVTFA
ncbi:hypothetical protein T01_12989 [Trichinella spiralis]|uniref:Uncharacterized protein n=1 Tax=Trichinella spiralis TaxID=6334 RepID=A0A0V1AYG4_TRISP|nr:hypothetical protein T01_12989 [Trichinella spiralis]